MNDMSPGGSLHAKFELNLSRNHKLDQTDNIAAATKAFDYQECRDSYWNPECYSLLYATPLWNQATDTQKIILNQLYWVAYYSQIISAEIATIFFNQVSAAGLYTYADFDIICENLDLETKQERVHINAFKTISKEVETTLFGHSLFSYETRNLFQETMIYANTNQLKSFWRKLQLQYYTATAASNIFLASQYLTIRGLRTLNGKLIQHQLSRHYHHAGKEQSPIPSRISYYHYCDESFHFNTSKLVGIDVSSCIPKPTRYEQWVINRAVAGCQQDHYHFSSVINGIFWYDPALYDKIYQLMRSDVFSMKHVDAMHMLELCFTKESEGLHLSYQTHHQATLSYQSFIAPLEFISPANRAMSIMSQQSIANYLALNTAKLRQFRQQHAKVHN